MSQGSNSSGGGSSGRTVATSAITQSGVIADLTGSPLVYSQMNYKKMGLNEASVKQLEKFWKDHKIRKSEYGMSVDKDGNVVRMEHGKKGTVDPRSPQDTYLMSHNHPRGSEYEAGDLGGTFSTGDTNWFTKEGKGKHVQVMTAETYEGRYIIAKGKNFDNDGFRQWSQQIHSEAERKYKNQSSNLRAKANAGEMSYTEWRDASKKAFNAYLVGLHNEILANQKKYGYTYGLEERK